MTDMITHHQVWVPGTAAPQGSKKYLGKGVMVESSKQVQPWRESIRWALLALPHTERAAWPIQGAVCVWLDFIMPRPASTPKKRTPPAVKRPDIDKLTRSALDAIGSAGVYRDDSQVIQLHCTKRLAQLDETPGLTITIEETTCT